MKAFTIEKNDENQRLDKFLTKAVPALPKNLLYKYLRLKKIKVNGKKTEISYRLVQGDELTLYIDDEFFITDEKLEFMTTKGGITVVYEDDNLLLCNKPAGLCVHADNDNSPDTLINRCLYYLYDKGEYSPESELSFVPALCNRIDRNTSGIVIVAKNAEALRLMNEKIKLREVKKDYICVVSGIMNEKRAKLTAYLQRNANQSTVRIYDKARKDTKTIITEYKVIDQTQQNSLLSVTLHTGRTHQIRAHMAYIKHPVIGDGKYGHGDTNRKYGQTKQLLCAYKLSFAFSDENILSYLNNREFVLNDVWFKTEFRSLF